MLLSEMSWIPRGDICAMSMSEGSVVCLTGVYPGGAGIGWDVNADLGSRSLT